MRTVSDRPRTLYWDSSAVVAALLSETHTRASRAHLRAAGAHLLSTLTYAEVLAALSRRLRQGRVSPAVHREMRARLSGEPWLRVDVQPSWSMLEDVAKEHALRGADCWHLATAMTLRQNIPELRLLTYDERLRSAAAATGLAA